MARKLCCERIDANQSEYKNSTKHAAFVDDLGGAGKLAEVRQWWDNVRHYGPMFRYYPNPSKSCLVVKDEEYNSATEIFQDTGVNITSSWRKYLGGFIGKVDEHRKYVKTIVDGWIEKIKLLLNIAKSEPQAAYAAFVSGFKHKFSYHIRVIPDITDLMKSVDDIIDTQFIPDTSYYRWKLLLSRWKVVISASCEDGRWLGIPILSQISEIENKNSINYSASLLQKIIHQDMYSRINLNEENNICNNISNQREDIQKHKLEELRTRMNSTLTMRWHDEDRNIFAEMLQQVCNDVAVEPSDAVNGRTIKSPKCKYRRRRSFRHTCKKFLDARWTSIFWRKYFQSIRFNTSQLVFNKFICQQRKRKETKMQPACYRYKARLFYTISIVSIWMM